MPMDERRQDPIRVLAVDDDPGALLMFQSISEESGFVFSGTTDPRECLSLMKSGRPHVLLLDIVMPEIDGLKKLVK